MPETETLTCGAGHTWTRPKARGRKPPFCPDHRIAIEPLSASETLTCSAGHTWTRPRQRGRKPPHCPEHRPVAVEKPAAETRAFDTHAQTIADYLAGNVIGAETKLKLLYIEKQLRTRREAEGDDEHNTQKDLQALKETGDYYMRQNDRTNKTGGQS